MQEALQNPHFKKIWEDVNWQGRHPEAKSLYSALMVEMEEHCAYGVVMRRVSRYYGRSITLRDMHRIDKYNTTQRPKILGRPITLEDILSLLKNKISAMPSWDKVEDRLKELNPQCCTATNKATKYTYNSYTQEYLSSEYGRAACEHVLFIGLMIGIQRFWQLTKPLHEQTPEIWEKIANLI